MDANQCVSLDKNWPKGYYRLGMAFSNLQQPSEAMMAFELGLAFLSDGDEDKMLEQEFNKKIKALQRNEADAQNVVKQDEVRRATVTTETMAATLDRRKEGDNCEGGVANIYVRTLSEGNTRTWIFKTCVTIVVFPISKVLITAVCLRKNVFPPSESFWLCQGQ